MTLTAKDNPGTFVLVPEGTHVAICYLLADLGEQENTFKPGNTVHKVALGWEIPEERLEDGRPLTITSMYTLSLNEKANLRKHLEAWRGRKFTDAELEGFDLRGIIGKACQLSVIHKVSGDRTFANVGGIVALPKSMAAPAPYYEPLVYDLEEHDEQTFQALPEWIRTMIENAGKVTQPAQNGAEATKALDEGSVPF